MSDQKIHASAAKPPLNLIPLSALVGVARVFGYGAKKYALGNFLRATDDDIGNRYIGGVLRHCAALQRPDGLYDLESLSTLDSESGLPEIDHMLCGLIMLRAILVTRGALHVDPAAAALSADTVEFRRRALPTNSPRKHTCSSECTGGRCCE